MEQQLCCSRRLRLLVMNEETEQVQRNETNASNTGTVNHTHMYVEGENNGNCKTNNENPQQVGDIGNTHTRRSDVVTPASARCRHPTRCPVVNYNDKTSVGTKFITLSRSIRDGARCASHSIGICSNTMYNISFLFIFTTTIG